MNIFFQSIESCFKNFLNSNGRASRSEYWYFNLFFIIANSLAVLLSLIMESMSFDDYINSGTFFVNYLDMIVYFVVLIPITTVFIRRLHDINRSGWWILISLTLIGLIPTLYWVCKKGDEGENRFGINPLKN